MARRQAVRVAHPPVIWILVADSKQAQIYVRQQVEKRVPVNGNALRDPFSDITACEPVPVEGMRWTAESADQYEAGRNSVGMVFESAAGAGRHMNEPHIDIKDEVRNHFARSIAGHLERAREAKAFDRLVLIAPAKMLGEIKKQLNKNVLKMVVAEMPKDLTHYDGNSLTGYLERL